MLHGETVTGSLLMKTRADVKSTSPAVNVSASFLLLQRGAA